MAEGSISREILFGTTQGVRKLIADGSNVNEKDIYGYTPLIQATIRSNFDIIQLLLEHGARIDEKDIAGQTALQWAVNRNHPDLAEFFLKNGADPNHYSADGQPILVYPYLRNQEVLINLLLKHGASLDFAQDFINAKLIGHRYELTGRADIINTRGHFIELDLEGFYLEFTVGIIQQSLEKFIKSAAYKPFSAYSTILSKILRTLQLGSELIQYKYTLKGAKENEARIKEILNQDLSVIPVTYAGHAITYQKYGNHLFAKCDRGVKEIVDTVVVSSVGNRTVLNADFMMELMYQSKTDAFINTEVKKILNLTPLATLPPRYQISGNCSFANVEASVPSMMFLLMFPADLNARGEIAALKRSIMDFYDTWVDWDKDRILDECIAEFHKADRARQASKAALLGSILLQRCNPNNKREVARAKKILPILTMPEFKYILKSYIKVYCTKLAGIKGEEFTKLLQICGLNFKTLTLQKPQVRSAH